jgi:hypothetical protein
MAFAEKEWLKLLWIKNNRINNTHQEYMNKKTFVTL